MSRHESRGIITTLTAALTNPRYAYNVGLIKYFSPVAWRL